MIDEPLLPNVGVLGLVPDNWGLFWQPRHHVLTRLTKYFQVVWVNPPHEWRKTVTSRRARRTQPVETAESAGVVVYTPEFWLPKLYRPQWLADFTFRRRLKRARRLLLQRGCQTIILYVWRPEFAPALRAIPFDLSCYHIDDEYSFADVAVPIDEAEVGLIAQADQVFIHSPGLLEEKGTINPQTAFVPNGVDYHAYSTGEPEPPDLAPIPHPRIGYTGVLKRTLDWALLLRLSELHPEWSFVFVGPVGPHAEVTGRIDELSARRNAYFLGGKPAQRLAAYPQHFDVCIMPYRVDSHMMKYGYPLKLHEYLASGRPVVGARIRSLEEFSDVVALPGSLDEWSAALTDALSPASNTPGRNAARQAVARRHDWQSLVATIAETICRRLGKEFADRFENLSACRDGGRRCRPASDRRSPITA
jgi:glycosyltransferase involved in cell wall biosynthesis